MPHGLAVGLVIVGFAIGICSAREVKAVSPNPCQKEYTEKFIKATADDFISGVAQGHAKPRMLLLFGGSGSGKGTFLNKHLAKHGVLVKDFIRHGLDEYIELLPEYKLTVADPNFVYKDAADGCYGGAIPISKAAQKLMIAARQHVIYEETGKNLDRVLKRVLPPFRNAGYDITLVLVDNLPEHGIQRAVGRFQDSGRYSSPEYVRSTFTGVFDNYRKLSKMGLVDESIYCDNSCVDDAWECMKCWNDSDTATNHVDPGRESTVPAEALESGAARYMTTAPPASKVPRQEI